MSSGLLAAQASSPAHQVDRIGGHALGEHLGPGVRLDLGELELGVVGVHRVDLLTAGRTQHLYDLHQLVHTALACMASGEHTLTFVQA